VTGLLSNDAPGDAAVSLAVKLAQDRIDSGELTAAQAARAKGFVQDNQGKGMADIMRGNMSAFLVMQAKSAGQPQLAKEVEARLNACRSAPCLAMVEARFSQKLSAATGKR